VGGGVDFGVAGGLEGLLDWLGGVVVLLLMMLLVLMLLVLGCGGYCGWEGGDVGLEVG
jgi:hypothetical protein